MRIRFIVISLVLFSWPAAASYSDLSSTQEFMDDDDDVMPIAASHLSMETCTLDLKDRYSARFQIDANLKQVLAYQNYDQTRLQSPMFCVGTGRIFPKLRRQACRTAIQEIDVCIDIQEKVHPDYVCDCFQIDYAYLKSPCPFGSIFFAHVGANGWPINSNTKASLEKYYHCLSAGGLFVYNSEVIHSKSLANRVLWHGVRSFGELKEKWVSELSDVGFEMIEVAIKDESKYFPPQAISILIIARKPDVKNF